MYEGDDNKRLDALRLAMELGADYIDVELKVVFSFPLLCITPAFCSSSRFTRIELLGNVIQNESHYSIRTNWRRVLLKITSSGFFYVDMIILMYSVL